MVVGALWITATTDHGARAQDRSDGGTLDLALALPDSGPCKITLQAHLDLGEGRLVMTGEDAADSLPLRSLAAMLAAGEVEVDDGLRFALRSLGALSQTLEIPAGRFVKLVVPFDGQARIERARTIVTSQGTVLRRVELARGVFRRLMESPDEARVKDL